MARSNGRRALSPRSDEPYKSTATDRPEDQHSGVIARSSLNADPMLVRKRSNL
jgi:hypothetical protein